MPARALSAAAPLRAPAQSPTPGPATPARSLLLVGIDTRPVDVEGALVALDTIATRLRSVGDARAVFPEVYGIITRNVATAIRAGGVFLEPGWIARLAGRFAERYFDALVPSLTGRPVPSDAWRVAFDAGRAGPRVPVRDAVLGINAHINYDLAQGIADNIRGFGHTDDAAMIARYRHDHDAVNAILLASMPEIYEVLLTRYGCRLTWLATRSRRANALLTRSVMRVLETWRSDVWDDMLVLLHTPAARRAPTLARMDRRASRLARGVAVSNPAWVAYRASARSLRASG